MLTKRFGFKQSRLDLSIYLRKDEEEMLVLVVQADDYLYVETSNLVSAFEEILYKQVYIGSTDVPLFNMMGVRLDVDGCGGIWIDAKKKTGWSRAPCNG